MDLTVITAGPNGQHVFDRDEVDIRTTKYKRLHGTYAVAQAEAFKIVFEVADTDTIATSYFAQGGMVECVLSVNPPSVGLYHADPKGSSGEDGGAVADFTGEVQRLRNDGSVVVSTDHHIDEIREVTNSSVS